MEAWAWLLAYVLGFGLLQLLLYRYFQGEHGRAEASPGNPESGARAGLDGGADEDAEWCACEHCGTTNERHPNIRFCRECASPLG